MLCEPLNHIFNKPVEIGIIPEDWKSANVTAFHKKGNGREPLNNRPIISLLTQESLFFLSYGNIGYYSTYEGFKHVSFFERYLIIILVVSVVTNICYQKKLSYMTIN